MAPPALSLRPILKHRNSSPHPTPLSCSPDHPHAHFPPSPRLTRTFSAYSASTYDRSPIPVAPNACALPARGCPGRTYTLSSDEEECDDSYTSPSYGPRYDLRAVLKKGYERSDELPFLVHDSSSSESDASDAPISPVLEPQSVAIVENALRNLSLSSSHSASYHHEQESSSDAEEARAIERARWLRKRSDKQQAAAGAYKNLSVCRAWADRGGQEVVDDVGCLGGF